MSEIVTNISMGQEEYIEKLLVLINYEEQYSLWNKLRLLEKDK